MKTEPLREGCLKLIETAAAKGDTTEVIRLSAILRELDEIQQLEQTLQSRKARAMDAMNTCPSTAEGAVPLAEVSMLSESTVLSRIVAREEGLAGRSRAKGKLERDKFLKDVRSHGKHLIPIRGTVYHNSHGQRIGLAFATERQSDRWFLGLKDENFVTIVLICEDVNHTVRRFVLPPDFCKRISKDLSRDQLGNVKFNVYREGRSYFLSIVGQNLEITKYIDFFDGIS
jgi:hypothetical protein